MTNDFLINIWNNVVIAVLFFLPAYIANMSPVILWRTGLWKSLRVPIDCGKTWRGHRVFGANKTYFGLITAVAGGAVGGILTFMIWGAISGGDVLWGALTGAILGFGAILGDLLESFFKRRLKIRPSDPLPFWDQVDFVLGSWVMFHFFNVFFHLSENFSFLDVSVWILIVGLILTPGLHLMANLVAYKLHWKDVWW